MFKYTLSVSTLIVVIFPSITFAHSGGLNAQGCHAGSKPYHCHRRQAPVQQTNIGGDRDCSDFISWGEAQRFFEQNGPNDPHRLDADNDGIACESLR